MEDRRYDAFETALCRLGDTIVKVSKILAGVAAAGGLAVAISAGDLEDPVGYAFGGSDEFNFKTFILVWILFLFGAVVTYYAGQILDHVLAALANLCYSNRMIMLNTTPMVNSQTVPAAGASKTVAAGVQSNAGWRCHICNRTHPIHVATCTCGQKRDEN